MVHVPKANGATRSCGDYAVTVNTQLQVPQYPISLPENVFLKLCGGQRSYASRSLKSSESFYTTLFGRKFFLRTDHKPLLKMFAMDSAKKKGGRRNLSCGLSDDAQSLPLKSLRKGLGTPCKQRHYCLRKMVGLFITAPILTSSHTSPAETNFLWSKAAFCGARELSYLP